MDTKEINIHIPEGYEIDEENSTFTCIKFRKKKEVKTWEEIPKIEGYYINMHSTAVYHYATKVTYTDKNVFLTEKHAKKALAIAQISQLMPYYGGEVNTTITKIFCVLYYTKRNDSPIIAETDDCACGILKFYTVQQAKDFLKYNEQLVKDYYMVD